MVPGIDRIDEFLKIIEEILERPGFQDPHTCENCEPIARFLPKRANPRWHALLELADIVWPQDKVGNRTAALARALLSLGYIAAIDFYEQERAR